MLAFNINTGSCEFFDAVTGRCNCPYPCGPFPAEALKRAPSEDGRIGMVIAHLCLGDKCRVPTNILEARRSSEGGIFPILGDDVGC